MSELILLNREVGDLAAMAAHIAAALAIADRLGIDMVGGHLATALALVEHDGAPAAIEEAMALGGGVNG